MDSVTQVVLGASVAEASLGKKLGNKALVWGAIGGTLPDLDVISGMWMDVASSLSFHRSVTHSLLFCVLFSPVMAWLARTFHKQRSMEQNISIGNWTALFFWIFLTHVLLDSFTTWGTQLFWPFSTYGVAFQSIFVVDPVYTLPFLGMLLVCCFLKPTSVLRRRINYVALTISTAYLLFTLVNKSWMNAQFENSLQMLSERDSVEYIRYSSRPTPFNNILWTANVELQNSFLIAYYSWFDGGREIAWKQIPKNHHYLKAGADYPSLAKMLYMMNGYYALDSLDGKLILNDLRFGQLVGWNEKGDSQEESFVFSYDVDFTETDAIIVEREKARDPEKMKSVLRKLWKRILGWDTETQTHL